MSLLNKALIVTTFFGALLNGDATFYLTLKGVKYRFELVKNGVASAPNLSAINQLANAAMGVIAGGATSATGSAKIGATNWSVTVSVA
jgi:hypothetical protein